MLNRLAVMTYGLVAFVTGAAHAQFTTIINVPPDVAPPSIGSDTQLNLMDGGVLPDSFDAGDLTSTNIEVNILGGSTSTLSTNSGTTVAISGGSVGTLTATTGSQVTISGGSVNGFGAFTGANVSVLGGRITFNSGARDGAHVQISGGEIASIFSVGDGGSTTISGGSFGFDENFPTFFAQQDGIADISGGSFGDIFRTDSGSTVALHGGDFRLDGVPVAGLGTIGNTVPFNLPGGSVLSGTFADGTPFAFSSISLDSIADGSLALQAASVTPGPAVISVPTNPAPLGVHNGQTLNLTTGGIIGDNLNAGWGSTVNINDGQVGRNFEAVGTEVTINGGQVGDFFEALVGSTVTINDGSVGDIFVASSGSEVRIAGGSVGDLFTASHGSVVTFSGGTVGSTAAFAGSEFHIIGQQFLLDGVDITDTLTEEVAETILDRDVTLSGLLADGTPFGFDLNSVDDFVNDIFDPAALLTVTLVNGDFNGDNVVNAADYTVWRDTLGATDLTPFTQGDANGDGQVTTADYDIWRTNFGGTLSSQANPSSIPEPLAATLTFIFVGWLAASRPPSEPPD